MLAYEILCISANCCTDRWNGVEKTGVPDTLALLNVDDVCHLEHLTWVVYDGALLVGPWPKLLGNCSWCTVLARLHQHIYRGHDDMAHCPPQTLGSWDCQEWIEALLHTKWVKTSIPVLEEVPKQLATPLPDAGSGD